MIVIDLINQCAFPPSVNDSSQWSDLLPSSYPVRQQNCSALFCCCRIVFVCGRQIQRIKLKASSFWRWRLPGCSLAACKTEPQATAEMSSGPHAERARPGNNNAPGGGLKLPVQEMERKAECVFERDGEVENCEGSCEKMMSLRFTEDCKQRVQNFGPGNCLIITCSTPDLRSRWDRTEQLNVLYFTFTEIVLVLEIKFWHLQNCNETM